MPSTHYIPTTRQHEPIPTHAFYVLATDSFFTGWGDSRGKRNIVVLGCDTPSRRPRPRTYLKAGAR